MSLPNVPKRVNRSLRVPHLDLLGLMQDEQRLHGFLGDIQHVRLMYEGNQAVDELQRAALNLVSSLALVLETNKKIRQIVPRLRYKNHPKMVKNKKDVHSA